MNGDDAARRGARVRGRGAVAGVALWIAGCGAVTEVVDGGRDALPADATAGADARPTDAARSDGTNPDGANPDAAPRADAAVSDAAPRLDAATDAAPRADAAGSDVAARPDAATPMCVGSASGQSSVWTCTPDARSRQRCVTGVVQTEACANGCVAQPLGTDDFCAAAPSDTVTCGYIQWWNRAYSWDPGFYAIRGTYAWDNDLAVTTGTAIQLRHAAQLVREGTYAWGWMPEFVDAVTGQRFAFLHLQPGRRMTTTVGANYPAGTLVGYSGGGTTDTGYCVAVPGCGTPDCAAGTCVYSTGPHLCVQTTVPFRTAFPMGTDACH